MTGFQNCKILPGIFILIRYILLNACTSTLRMEETCYHSSCLCRQKGNLSTGIISLCCKKLLKFLFLFIEFIDSNIDTVFQFGSFEACSMWTEYHVEKCIYSNFTEAGSFFPKSYKLGGKQFTIQ